MKILFAGGGTAGHINPAISIADYTKAMDPEFEALFVGTQRGLETKLVPNAGYDIEYIDIEGFSRRNMLKNFSVAKKLLLSKSKCKKILKKFAPDCVVCTGGYVSGPVAMAAKALKIPALIHEQNVYPGLTVKGAQKYVDYLALSFEETKNFMSAKEKCVVTGNPIRGEILSANKEECRKSLGIQKPFVLIFGGSLGADAINNAVLGMLQRIADEGKFSLLFGTGDRNYESIMQKVKDSGIELTEDIKIVPYINNMAECMAAADVVVSRAGAITVSEIAALAKPSILIPSPNVVRNHQEQNAREFVKNGAAKMITEDKLSADTLYNNIVNMIEDESALAKMSQNLRSLAKTDALQRIYDLIIKMCAKN